MVPVDDLLADLAAGDMWAGRRLIEQIDVEAEAVAMIDAVWIRHHRGPAPWAEHRPRSQYRPPTVRDAEAMAIAADVLDDLDAW